MSDDAKDVFRTGHALQSLSHEDPMRCETASQES